MFWLLAMNWADVFVTAGATAGLGFIAFVVGQLVLTLIVQPVHEQARIVGEVAHALTYYRGVSSDTSDFGPRGSRST